LVRVFTNHVFVGSYIDTADLVCRHVAVQPLDLRSKAIQRQSANCRILTTIARESAQWDRYIDPIDSEPLGETLRAPSVICNNALVASLIGLRILAIALGTTPQAICGTHRYYVEEGKLAWAATRQCKSRCTKRSWIGLGDSHWIPVGTDLRWREIQKREVQDSTGENQA
jgi:hypothetical protein